MSGSADALCAASPEQRTPLQMTGRLGARGQQVCHSFSQIPDAEPADLGHRNPRLGRHAARGPTALFPVAPDRRPRDLRRCTKPDPRTGSLPHATLPSLRHLTVTASDEPLATARASSSCQACHEVPASPHQPKVAQHPVTGPLSRPEEEQSPCPQSPRTSGENSSGGISFREDLPTTLPRGPSSLVPKPDYLRSSLSIESSTEGRIRRPAHDAR